jgi:ketosteroid isomerase-like protein
MKSTTFSFTLMALFFLANLPAMIAQSVSNEPSRDELFREIANMDEVLFNAFNNGDMEKIKTLFTEDLEFYHDKGGLSGYQSNIEAIGRLSTGEVKIRRALVEGSLKVYPVPGYGAIQEGRHDFFETLPGQTEHQTGSFKFIHIWKKTDDGWKIARVVSYDH